MTTPPEYEYDGYALELSPDDFVVEGDQVVVNDKRLANAARAIQDRARDAGGTTVTIWIKK